MKCQDHPTEPDLLGQAHLAYLRGQWQEARLALERLLICEPDNGAARDLLAEVDARQIGPAEAARLALSRLRQAQPQGA